MLLARSMSRVVSSASEELQAITISASDLLTHGPRPSHVALVLRQLRTPPSRSWSCAPKSSSPDRTSHRGIGVAILAQSVSKGVVGRRESVIGTLLTGCDGKSWRFEASNLRPLRVIYAIRGSINGLRHSLRARTTTVSRDGPGNQPNIHRTSFLEPIEESGRA
jgi:hypothetical protein